MKLVASAKAEIRVLRINVVEGSVTLDISMPGGGRSVKKLEIGETYENTVAINLHIPDQPGVDVEVDFQ